jgi:hypothetical protein
VGLLRGELESRTNDLLFVSPGRCTTTRHMSRVTHHTPRFTTLVDIVMSDDEDSILHSLDSLAPESLAQFDAFPKLPLTYKSRSDERGFLTIFVALVAVLLVLNDLGEFIWGWPDTEFSVDHGMESFMRVNLDMVVNMPCHCEYWRFQTASVVE